ncbi:MAG: hypothetical protein DRP47_01870 [Candidatus Zixiibacteriota bacterium]|nr:MAG: hypothetical protein DRP47_01870 [candidate division Zixibacteria bacterium]
MITLISNNRGSALLIALSLLIMLSLLALAAVNNSTTDIDLSGNQVSAEKAFYIAEAGAKRAFTEIVADSTWRTGFANVSFNGGLYTVTVTDSTTDSTLADTVVVNSTGSALMGSAIVQLILAPGEVHPFKYAMFGEDTIDIRNSFVTDSYNSDSGSYWATRLNTDADIGSNGNIIVKNGAVIGGDVATSLAGGASINPGATVTGTISDTAPEQELPEVPAADYTWAEANNIAPSGFTGSYSYDPSTNALISSGNLVLDGGVYFFSSIILKNSASLSVAPGAEVVIYVTGDIEMKQSSEVNSGGDPADFLIYSQGDLTLKNSGDIAALFYSPDGNVDLRNSGEFSGSIVAETIVAHNSANFHYDRSLGSITFPGSGGVEVVGFREL